MSGHPDKTFDRKLLCTMSSCELNRCEGPEFSRKWRKEEDAGHLSLMNEEVPNETTGNMPTAVWGPASVYPSVY